MTELSERIQCVVTRYSIVDGVLVPHTATEVTSYWIERGYLFLGNSEASARVDALREAALSGRGWGAQFGTAPVYVDGEFGGRNYPAIQVECAELRRVLGLGT